ncbi:MAG: host attachment protein [Rickettsiales bacterium]
MAFYLPWNGLNNITSLQRSKLWVAVIDRKHAFFYMKQSSKKLVKLNYELTAKPLRPDFNTRRSMAGAFEDNGAEKHIFEPRIRTKEMRDFIRDVLKYLESSFINHSYSKLVLVASPKVLGFVRKKLSQQLRENIVFELDRDYTHLPVEKLALQLDSYAMGRGSSRSGCNYR